jgi:DNA polymerase III alpha subunit
VRCDYRELRRKEKTGLTPGLLPSVQFTTGRLKKQCTTWRDGLSTQSIAMKFVSFEDTTGIYETVFFPKVYNRFCHMLNEMRPYLLKGKVEEDFTAVTLTVHWIEFLDKVKREKQAFPKQSTKAIQNLT